MSKRTMGQCRYQELAAAAESAVEKIAAQLPATDQATLLKAVELLRELEFQDGRDDTQFNGW